MIHALIFVFMKLRKVPLAYVNHVCDCLWSADGWLFEKQSILFSEVIVRGLDLQQWEKNSHQARRVEMTALCFPKSRIQFRNLLLLPTSSSVLQSFNTYISHSNAGQNGSPIQSRQGGQSWHCSSDPWNRTAGWTTTMEGSPRIRTWRLVMHLSCFWSTESVLFWSEEVRIREKRLWINICRTGSRLERSHDHQSSRCSLP